MIESLRIVRRNGYAIDREEYLPGVICVGAAIRDQAGTVIGAISASTPTMRATDEHIALMRDEIIAATRALSAEFGEPTSQPKATGRRPSPIDRRTSHPQFIVWRNHVRTARREDQPQRISDSRHA